jgi:hypothetical protein
MVANQPFLVALGCMELTDRRVYFTWDNIRRDIPLFTDEESKLEIIPSPGAPAIVETVTWEDARPIHRRHHTSDGAAMP